MRDFTKTYSVDLILPHIENNKFIILENKYWVKAWNPTLKVFKKMGTTCCNCGLKAVEFVLMSRPVNKQEQDSGETDKYVYAMELYGYLSGKPVLFTKDHIKPRSKGGGENCPNFQVMCQICNRYKSNHELHREGERGFKLSSKAKSAKRRMAHQKRIVEMFYDKVDSMLFAML
jgi:hypothetical protein